MSNYFGDSRFTQEMEYEQEQAFESPFATHQEYESPFRRTFDVPGVGAELSPFREEYVRLRSSLDDGEFTEHLYEVAAELEDYLSQQPMYETVAGEDLLPQATLFATGYFAPLIRATDEMIDTVARRFSGTQMEDHSEMEVERFFNELEFDHSELSPAQENLFGGLFNKVKGLVKKGIDLAKKGISAVGKLLPINIVLNKLKAVVKPLLDKVLRFAMGKLPKKFQPFAQMLAKKMLGIDVPIPGAPAPAPGGSETEGEVTGETVAAELPATGELESVQTELDTHLAQLVFSPNEMEAEQLLGEYEASSAELQSQQGAEPGLAAIPSMGAAREQLVRDLEALAPGESAEAAIERFLPGPLMALTPIFKLASAIIGKQKIVNFLAGLLADLVGNFIPKEMARPLATSIVETGLGVLGFETEEAGRTGLAYEAIASTIQETMERMAGELDETSLEDREALTAQLLEAFEVAASHHFPASYLREGLRSGATAGVWILKPRGYRHAYKKYSRVFDIVIDPQCAHRILSFRSLPLAHFLRDKLGLDPDAPIHARVHLYEAIDGTRLSHISKHEHLRGLGTTGGHDYIMLHPLTRDAATLLLKEPFMGRDLPAHYLHRRHQIALGQRFYELEIAGSRVRTATTDNKQHHHHKHVHGKGHPHQRPARSADVQGVLDFTTGEIRLDYYFSEEDSKSIVEKLNANDFAAAASGVRYSVKHVLRQVLLRHVGSKVKVVHEAMPELYLDHYQAQDEYRRGGGQGGGGFHGGGHHGGHHHHHHKVALDPGHVMLVGLIRKLIGRIAHSSYDSIVELFKTRSEEFKKAQAEQKDGVTIKLSWKNIAGLAAFRVLIGQIRTKQPVGDLSAIHLPEIPKPAIVVVAGKNFQ